MDYKLGLLALAGAGLVVAAALFLYPVDSGRVSFVVFDDQAEALASNVAWTASVGESQVGSGTLEAGKWEMPALASDFVVTVSSPDGRRVEKSISSTARSVFIRLPRQAAAVPSSSLVGGVRFVIVTSSTGLRRAYGEEGAKKVFDAAGSLAKAVEQEEGFKSAVVTLESEASLPPGASESGFLSAFQSVYARYSAADYVLILGGEDVVPFQKVINPLQGTDSDSLKWIGAADSFVYSDQPYADARLFACQECAVPALGRMVSFKDAPAEHLASLLDAAAAAHYSRLSASPAFFIASGDSLDYTRKQVVAGEGDSLGSSPPIGVSKLFTGSPAVDSALLSGPLAASNSLVFTLHGNNPGQPQSLVGRMAALGDVLVLDPSNVKDYSFSGKFVFADSCYSASPDRTSGQSVVAGMLEGGALGFVGPTTSALANRKITSVSQPSDADFLKAGAANGLVHFTLEGLRGGKRIGDSLRDAKARLKEKAIGKPSVAWFVDELTRDQFVLYGDPTLRISG